MKVTATFSIDGKPVGEPIVSEHPDEPAVLAWTEYAKTLLVLIQDRDVLPNQMVKLRET